MSVRSVSAVLIALCMAGSAATQERIVTSLTADQVEQLLKGLGLECKKSVSRKSDGLLYYDFTLSKSRFNTRLHYFQGKDIMLDALFPEQPLEMLNRWNSTRAKVTRASSHHDGKTTYTALEANLNFGGGVTENTVRRFIQDFGDEIAAFDRFLGGKEVAVNVGADGDKIFTLTTEKIEDIMGKLKLTTKKQSFKGDVYYDYESTKNYKVRLSNYGNKELKLDAVFKKLPLESINAYNFNRKFIRTVLCNQGKVDYTALEANLDCSAGISENMIRHFMITFEEEIQTFIDFMNKN